MAGTPSKQERDRNQTLATLLDLFVAQGVLTLLSIMRRIKKSRVPGVARVAMLNGERITRSLLKFWDGDAVSYAHHLMMNGAEPTIAKILERMSDEQLTELVEGWMSEKVEVEHRLTFEQIANSFDPDELWASVRVGLTMVGLLPSEADDAPDAEVVEEVVVDDTGTNEPPPLPEE